MLTVDPKKRPDINEVIKMPILAKSMMSMMKDASFKEEFT